VNASTTGLKEHDMEQHLKEINQSEFLPLVLDGEGLSLVEFGAPWCPPCKALVPILKHIEKQYADRLSVYTVNTDASPDLAIHYDIRGLPTVILFKGGKIVDQLHGKQPLGAYQAAIDRSFEQG